MTGQTYRVHVHVGIGADRSQDAGREGMYRGEDKRGEEKRGEEGNVQNTYICASELGVVIDGTFSARSSPGCNRREMGHRLPRQGGGGDCSAQSAGG